MTESESESGPLTVAQNFVFNLWLGLRWFITQIVRQFLAHDCLASAGALTYTTLFAVVPMMTVAYAMFSLLPEFAGVGDRLQAFLFNNFVPDSGVVVQEKLVEFTERARGITAAGFAFLLVTAFLMLVTTEKAFNSIWQVAEPRRGLQRFLLYWAVLSLGPFLIAGGILISLYLFSLPLVSDLDTFGVGHTLATYLPRLFTIAGFTVMYYAVPNCDVPFRHALLGGLLTTAAFEGSKTGFAWVVTNSSIEPIYGTFAAVPLFLAWLYLMWVLILSGAIFVRTLSLSREVPRGDLSEPLLVKGARVVQLLYDAHMQGQTITVQDVNNRVSMSRFEHDRIFSALGSMKILSETDDDRLMLGRNLKSLTLWDLYQQLPEGLDVQLLDKISDMEPIVIPLRNLTTFGSNEMNVSLDSVFGALK
ncbi:MAG: YihY family inner membrane protein [Proteobacteria bacterium]|nr:YihY family inner membrane protein [Pseudomonadota bacterium]